MTEQKIILKWETEKFLKVKKNGFGGVNLSFGDNMGESLIQRLNKEEATELANALLTVIKDLK